LLEKGSSKISENYFYENM